MKAYRWQLKGVQPLPSTRKLSSARMHGTIEAAAAVALLHVPRPARTMTVEQLHELPQVGRQAGSAGGSAPHSPLSPVQYCLSDDPPTCSVARLLIRSWGMHAAKEWTVTSPPLQLQQQQQSS